MPYSPSSANHKGVYVTVHPNPTGIRDKCSFICKECGYNEVKEVDLDNVPYAVVKFQYEHRHLPEAEVSSPYGTDRVFKF